MLKTDARLCGDNNPERHRGHQTNCHNIWFFSSPVFSPDRRLHQSEEKKNPKQICLAYLTNAYQNPILKQTAISLAAKNLLFSTG